MEELTGPVKSEIDLGGPEETGWMCLLPISPGMYTARDVSCDIRLWT